MAGRNFVGHAVTERADLKSDFRISLGDGLTKTFADTQAVRTARTGVDREMANT